MCYEGGLATHLAKTISERIVGQMQQQLTADRKQYTLTKKIINEF